MADRLVVCMVINGKATLYEQGAHGADAFSTLRVPQHFDEDRAMAWALGTMSVLALDAVHDADVIEHANGNGNGHKPRALAAANGSTNGKRAKTSEWPAEQVLRLIEQEPGLTRAELRTMTGLSPKLIGNRITTLLAKSLIRRSGEAMRGRYYPIRRMT